MCSNNGCRWNCLMGLPTWGRWCNSVLVILGLQKPQGDLQPYWLVWNIALNSDCCINAWTPSNLIQRLQSVQNAAARLIFRMRSQNTLPQLSSAFTGCASQNVFHSNWQLWRIDPPTAPLRPIYSRVSPAFPTWHSDDGCGLLPHIVLNFRPFVSPQSASGRFRFLMQPSGTTCLSTSHLRRHSRFSDNDSRRICFSVPTNTLSYDSCDTVWTHVVLAIINII